MMQRRHLLTLAIVSMLGMLCFFPVVLIFICGGVGTALFGLAMVGVLIVCQLPVFWLLKRVGVVPTRAGQLVQRGQGND